MKELRDKTGAGMMDCKAALTEVKGDIEAAIDWLRKKGLSKAAKKAGRIAAEGLIGIDVSGKSGSVVEVNSETDFVARNEQFQEMVTNIASLAGKAGGDVAKLLAMTYPGKKITVEEQVKELIATIGENMSVRRTATLQVSEGVVGSYVHSQVAPGLGKIGVLVALEVDRQERRRARGSRPPARHARRRHQSRSPSISPACRPRRWRARRRSSPTRTRASPRRCIEKIVASGLKSYGKDNCLLEQAYIHDPSKSVTQAAQGRRRQGRRPDQAHRLRALRAGRGHREEGRRLRRRGCRGGRRVQLRQT